MKRNDFLLLLDELLELEPATLKGPEALDNVEGWNSLAVISFMALVEEHLGVSLAPQQIVKCQTVNDLVGSLGDRISAESRT